MNGKTLMAMAVAGVFMGATSVWAGGAHKQSGLPKHSVQTPVTVSDATPDQAYSSSSSFGGRASAAIGASSDASGSGSAAFDLSPDSSASTDYWRMDEESSIGASSSAGASGSVGMDLSVSSDSADSTE